MGNATNPKKWSARERLLFIERITYWRGWIRRTDICSRFHVSVPQASSDITEYRRMNRSALAYDSTRKCYVAKRQMKLVLGSTAFEEGIALLSDSSVARLAHLSATVDLPRHHIPEAAAKELLRAVLARIPLQIFYYSVNSGTERWRCIFPSAFGYDGYRWHVRAWCYERKMHRDFVIGRIAKTRSCDPPTGDVPIDAEWNSWTTIRFRPHQSLTTVQRTAVAMDFGMRRNYAKLRIRRAMLHYSLVYLGMHPDSSAMHRRIQLVSTSL